ncbi:hypothetical protein M422DRAFT_252543 [Sphaerobolus stellatus SS14]|uniref:Protein kinase domain-containing protein n=1 Tax=Sphaerobolus stellatus (strain SS14) TaxID=990650 RepID=A0A0C9VYG7_SPHS4|nr:hypothetical protein M422DRAFT_252543 [Sphaerobolus stellatus SS14]
MHNAAYDEDGEQRVADNQITDATKWVKGASIGTGSSGNVYLATDSSSGLLMAVKQVELPTGSTPNEEHKKSTLHAYLELLKQLQHQNVVQYIDSYSDEVYLNIFLEYIPGGSVASLLKNYGAFEESLVCSFVRQTLQGLVYLHERDITHGDIKGASILVDNKGTVKLSGFAMNRPSASSLFWVAPEVVRQTAYTQKADVWSLGCLVIEMFTGEHPWPQLTQMQAVFQIGSEGARPAFPSDISSNAEDFLSKTFEVEHTIRPSAAQLLQHPWTNRSS